MHNFSLIETRGDAGRAVNMLLAGLLEQNIVQAVIVPAAVPPSVLPMTRLLNNPSDLDQASPLAPVAGVSAATQVAKISRGPQEIKIAAVLRPCEMRAVVELHKLNQAQLDNLFLIGLECPGRLENQDYIDLQDQNQDLDQRFYRDEDLQSRIAITCRSCTDFLPENAHLNICVLGLDLDQQAGIAWDEGAGAHAAEALELKPGQEPGERGRAVDSLRSQRESAREEVMSRSRETISSSSGLQSMIAHCLGCFNCQRACPVCFCRECVCSREAFEQNLEMLHTRAGRTGGIRLPAGMTMFHLTRLAHMAHACVGCGQCSSVCPIHIPVADIFRTVGARTQEELDYKAGRSPEEPIPHLNFSTEGDQ